MSQKSSALSILFEGGETLAIYDSTNIVAKKTTTSFVNKD
jgi:hypothetical protein